MAPAFVVLLAHAVMAEASLENLMLATDGSCVTGTSAIQRSSERRLMAGSLVEEATAAARRTPSGWRRRSRRGQEGAAVERRVEVEEEYERGLRMLDQLLEDTDFKQTLWAQLMEVPVQLVRSMSNVFFDSGATLPRNPKACAVVSSSHSVLAAEAGEKIDSVDGPVMRFNLAPTKNFDQWVGNRTDIMVINDQIPLLWEKNGKYPPDSRRLTFLLNTFGIQLRTAPLQALRDRTKHLYSLHFSPMNDGLYNVMETVRCHTEANCTEANGAQTNGTIGTNGTKQRSHEHPGHPWATSGMVGLTMLLNLCEEVRHYGFLAVAEQETTDLCREHYWEGTKKCTRDRHHKLTDEHALWAAISTRGELPGEGIIPGMARLQGAPFADTTFPVRKPKPPPKADVVVAPGGSPAAATVPPPPAPPLARAPGPADAAGHLPAGLVQERRTPSVRSKAQAAPATRQEYVLFITRVAIGIGAALALYVAYNATHAYLDRAGLKHEHICICLFMLLSVSNDLSIKAATEKNGHFAFDPAVNVCVSEGCKLLVSSILFCMTLVNREERANIILPSTRDVGLLFIPGLVYTANNIIVFKAIENVPIATFAVVRETRIVWTAMIWLILFRVPLGPIRWLGIIGVLAGTSANQIPAMLRSEFTLGVFWPLLGAFLNATGTVTCEFAMKHKATVDINLQNMILYAACSSLAFLYVAVFQTKELYSAAAFFHGFTPACLQILVIQIMNGLTISRILKHVESMTKSMVGALCGPLTVFLGTAILNTRLRANEIVAACVVVCSCILFMKQGALNSSAIKPEDPTLPPAKVA